MTIFAKQFSEKGKPDTAEINELEKGFTAPPTMVL